MRSSSLLPSSSFSFSSNNKLHLPFNSLYLYEFESMDKFVSYMKMSKCSQKMSVTYHACIFGY